MAQAKTRYLVVDWDNRETEVMETKDELLDHIDQLVESTGMSRENCSDEDLEIEIWKVLPSSKPKRMNMFYSVTPKIELTDVP